MTLWVSRDDQAVTIHGNTNLDVKVERSQVREFTVTEHWQHLKHFWSQLGHELEQAEQAAQAEALNSVDSPG